MKTFNADIYSTLPNSDGNPDSDMETTVINLTASSPSIIDFLEILKINLAVSELANSSLAIDIEEIE